MATFTVRLSKLIADGVDLGLTDYPIFDEAYRAGLNDKILAHYYNYEIGQETVSMFVFALNRRMNEIMPYYNQMYRSTMVEFDPLLTHRMEHVTLTENERDQTGSVNTTVSQGSTATTVTTDVGNTEKVESATTASSTTSEGKSRNVSSAYPQVSLQANKDYATSGADSSSLSESSVDGTSSGSTSVDSTNTVNASETGQVDRTDGQTSTYAASLSGRVSHTATGFQAHTADLIDRWRSIFLNVDMDVIERLNDLFMQLWDNGDEFSERRDGYHGWFYGFWPHSF